MHTEFTGSGFSKLLMKFIVDNMDENNYDKTKNRTRNFLDLDLNQRSSFSAID